MHAESSLESLSIASSPLAVGRVFRLDPWSVRRAWPRILAMGGTASATTTSEDEYLEVERRSETKHELISGLIVAMAGGTFRHNDVAANTLTALRVLLRGKGCKAVGSDQRVHVPATGLFTYPDVTVVCGTPEFHPKDRDTLLNPRVLVEVLSDSTEAYDRGAKFAHYRSIPSFVEYLLVAQDEPRVEHFKRFETGQWLLTVYRGESARVELPALGCELRVGELYEGVDPGGPS
jgi:Uma2 family endonuclease